MTKLDIGVHTYSGIEQDSLLFSFQDSSQGIRLLVNPNEQIFAEKIISLAKLGPISTRYKDVYDIFYLIHGGLLEKEKASIALSMFLESGNYPFSSKEEVYERIDETLNNSTFSHNAMQPIFDWIDASYSEVTKAILDFLFAL
jgi:predicted nucleotidyltransferase component of viral defense system